jgi:hypothetical protein
MPSEVTHEARDVHFLMYGIIVLLPSALIGTPLITFLLNKKLKNKI